MEENSEAVVGTDAETVVSAELASLNARRAAYMTALTALRLEEVHVTVASTGTVTDVSVRMYLSDLIAMINSKIATIEEVG